MAALPTLGEVASRSLPLVSADQSLSKAAEVMLANRALGVVTADVKRRPMLVLSYRALVRAIARGAHPQSRVSEHAVDEPVFALESMSVIDGLGIMRKTGVRFLPVVDERGRITGVFEPYHAARSLWEMLDYGDAMVEARARGLVALPGDATIREAARAMDENGVPEILVRAGEEERILREEDFLRAVAEERLDARVADYARGPVIRVPPGFDAKSAVELMLENGVRRLLVTGLERPVFATLTDLAFEAADLLSSRRPLETGFVLVRVEPGRVEEVASKAIMEEWVSEVHMVTGDYDVLVRIDAPSLREIHRVAREVIARLPGVLETKTFTGVRVAAKKAP
ncbi:MAG: CBS domain-containing protein [Desulfurococcales archaeon]|nr:CBS domain-containing protein [Desulfurococcales archaeon]